MVTTKRITIDANMVKHSLEGAYAQGVDIPRLLRKCRIGPELLETPGARIPVDQVVKLHRYCNGTMQDEFNGLLERPLRLGTFRQMALSSVHTPTLGKALERCIEFVNLFENSLLYHLETKRREATLALSRIPDQQLQNNYAIGSLLSTLHRFIGWLGNDRIILNQVQLDHPVPTYKEEFQYMFYGAPVLYKQASNRIHFDKQYLDHPVVQTEASVEAYVRRAPMDLYLPLATGGDWTIEARSRIKEAFGQHQQLLKLDQLAMEMGVNSQTLRRRLKSEGSSFDMIKSQFRRDIAIHHLGDNNNSIENIAEACGYAEPSAFIRAFKNWTGFTPLQFRKGLDSL